MQRTKTLAYESLSPTAGDEGAGERDRDAGPREVRPRLESKVAKSSADKPDSVAPASGIRLVRPPLATLPGASSVPPPPSAAPSARSAPPPPPVRAVARTLPLALAPIPAPPRVAVAAKTVASVGPVAPVPAAPRPLTSARAMFGSPKTLVPPPPPSGLRARGLSSAPPPPSRRPPRPEPQLLDDDSVVEDDAETVAETGDIMEVEATPIPSPPRRSSAPPRSGAPSKLPSLKATGQNWPRVEWPRLDTAARAPAPASVRPAAPPRPASSPPPPPALLAVIEEAPTAVNDVTEALLFAQEAPVSDIGGTAYSIDAPDSCAGEAMVEAMPTAAAVDAHLDAALTPIPTGDDVYVDAPPAVRGHMQLVPPPPDGTADGTPGGEGDMEVVDTTSTTSLVYEEDAIDFRPESPIVRLRKALAQAGPIVAWLDANPRAFASVGFGAGVVVALFVALVVQ
jgi:hypothetical protein